MPLGKTHPNPCPECNGEMWDNRGNKKNPKAPDAKCKDKECEGVIWPGEAVETHFGTPRGAAVGARNARGDDRFQKIDGITEARQHIMRAANLYVLCIRATENYIAKHFPAIAQTGEQFQSTLASFWIEASSRRSTDGVNWWSYIDKMDTKPLPVQNRNEKVERPPAEADENETIPF